MESWTSLRSVVERHLLKSLTHPNEDIRTEAATRLAQSKNIDVINQLKNELKTDPAARVRYSAAWALGVIGDGSADRELTDAVENDPSDAVQFHALRALAMIREKKTGTSSRSFQAVAENPDSSLQAVALMALAQFKDPQTISTFVKALGSDKESIVQLAEQTLKDFRLAAIPALTDCSKD